jgi:hypothetical protein
MVFIKDNHHGGNERFGVHLAWLYDIQTGTWSIPNLPLLPVGRRTYDPYDRMMLTVETPGGRTFRQNWDDTYDVCLVSESKAMDNASRSFEMLGLERMAWLERKENAATTNSTNSHRTSRTYMLYSSLEAAVKSPSMVLLMAPGRSLHRSSKLKTSPLLAESLALTRTSLNVFSCNTKGETETLHSKP